MEKTDVLSGVPFPAGLVVFLFAAYCVGISAYAWRVETRTHLSILAWQDLVVAWLMPQLYFLKYINVFARPWCPSEKFTVGGWTAPTAPILILLGLGFYSWHLNFAVGVSWLLWCATLLWYLMPLALTLAFFLNKQRGRVVHVAPYNIYQSRGWWKNIVVVLLMGVMAYVWLKAFMVLGLPCAEGCCFSSAGVRLATFIAICLLSLAAVVYGFLRVNAWRERG